MGRPYRFLTFGGTLWHGFCYVLNFHKNVWHGFCSAQNKMFHVEQRKGGNLIVTAFLFVLPFSYSI
jgi:hypothetical protein